MKPLRHLLALLVAAVIAGSCTASDADTGQTTTTLTTSSTIVATTTTAVLNAAGTRPWLDTTLDVETRVELLLSEMTPDEKYGQMTLVELGSIDPADIASLGIGGLLSGGDGIPSQFDPAAPNEPLAWRDLVAEFQAEAAMSRLGIPLLYGIDAVHGHGLAEGAVLFPHNIGLGAAGDPDLVRRIGAATAEEMLATGIRWNFAPTLAVVQDIRWGRTYESFGQDPELTAELGAAFVEGLQSAPDQRTVLATAKHFIGDGGVEFGTSLVPGYLIDQGDTRVTDDELRRIHLPPFRAALDAEARVVMASFSRVNGQFAHGSHALLTGLLKEELGFDGFVVSDWAGIDQITTDYPQAVGAAVSAGIDMNMVPGRYPEYLDALADGVERRRIDEARIDDAVRRILRVKFEAGLFEQPLGDASAAFGSDDHRDLAREAVGRSATLLTDTGVFPLPIDAAVAIAGSGADDPGMQAGGWTQSWQGRLGDLTGATSIIEAVTAVAATPPAHLRDDEDWSAAGLADIGIVVVGEPPYSEGLGDTETPELSADDLATVARMTTVAETVVVVVLAGRPLIMPDVFAAADAVVMAWLPGTEGAGIADVLYGRRPFTGRLPVAWPASVDQLPAGVDTDPDAVLFPVGHGIVDP